MLICVIFDIRYARSATKFRIRVEQSQLSAPGFSKFLDMIEEDHSPKKSAPRKSAESMKFWIGNAVGVVAAVEFWGGIIIGVFFAIAAIVAAIVAAIPVFKSWIG